MTPFDVLVIGRVAMLGGGADSAVDAGGADGAGGVATAIGARPNTGVAIAGGRIVAVGDARDLRDAAARSTRIVETRPDEMILPGFTDAHLHLGEAALAADALDLGATTSLDEALRLVAERHRALPPGEWLMGLGWQAGLWRRWPSAAELESVAPGRPAFLWSYDHHAVWLSEAALAAAHITAETPDPPSGRIARDAHGNPSGILHENVEIASAALPVVTTERLAAAIERYAASLVRLGIVAVHDPGPLTPDPELRLDLAACRALAASGRLPLRVHVSVRADSLAYAARRGLRSGDDLLPVDAPPELRGRARVGWLKLFADGALGSRTAALLEPYERAAGVRLPAGERGILTTSRKALASLVTQAASQGIATQIHAIGDAAVRAALDAFDETRAATAALPLGPRIEHAQLVGPADMGRFRELGVVASVQPSHVATDAEGAEAAWGRRGLTHGYPYGDLARAGATLAFGSDAPVERADPWAALALATHRSRGAGAPVLLGEHQRLSLREALIASCAAPADAAAQRDAGRIAPGALADLVVVPETALEAPWGTRPRLVIASGVVWD